MRTKVHAATQRGWGEMGELSIAPNFLITYKVKPKQTQKIRFFTLSEVGCLYWSIARHNVTMSQHHFQMLLFWINIVSTFSLHSGKRSAIFLSSLLPYSPAEPFQFSEVQRDPAVCIFCYECGAWNARVNDMRRRASLLVSSPRLRLPRTQW